MQFQLRVFDPQTQAVRELAVQAASREDAAAQLQTLGQGQAWVLAAKAGASAVGGSGRGLDVAWWCKELRTLLAAGMTVVEALETLNAQSLGAARSRVHAGLVERLGQGQALSDAMAASGEFPSVLVASVRASERTSSLVQALDDFLRYHQMLDTMRKKVVSTAIYPAVVVALGALITLFLLLYVVPRFSRMYADLRGPVSTATQVLVGLSRLLTEHGLVVVGIAALLLAALVVAWRTGWLAKALGAAALRVGPLQRQLDEFRLAKLYQSLALMFKGGFALDDALAQCQGLGLGQRLTHGVLAAKAALGRGERVSKALGDAGLTDVVSQRLLAVGERTGNFDRVLSTIAERHADNFATFIERSTRLIEPLLLLLVALVVGGIVVMMYMPIFDIASSVR